MNHYETIISNLNAIVFSFNKEGIFTSSNGKGLEIIGLKPGQVVGMSVFDVYQNEPLIVENCKKALKGEATRSTVFVGDLAFDTSFTPVIDSNGEIEQVVGISVNVTGYKETEAELNELKQKLEEEKVLMDNLMENIPDTIYFKDKESRFIRVSASMKNKLGAQSMEDIIGKTDFDFQQKENAKKFFEDEKRIIASEIPMVNDLIQVKTKSGEEIWEATTKMPLHDKQNNVVGTFGFTKDVTEIKNSEEKHRAIFESAKDAFIIVNPEGKITEANPSACKTYGYQYQEMIDMPAKNLVHPNHQNEFANTLKSIQTNGDFNGENLDIKKDGTAFESEIYCTSIKYNNQQHILSVIRDISARKKKEEELNLKNIVYNTSVAANSISDTNGVLTSVNKSFLKAWGYNSFDEVIGKPIPAFIKFEEEAVEILNGLTNTGKWQGTYTALKKDGSTFIAMASASILQDINGNLIGYQSSVFDVTEAKEAEEKIKNTQKELERSNKELEQFAYISSHDLQEPLRKIKSYSELLEMRYKDQLDEKAGKYLNVITSGAERMQTLIDDLLTYSRVTTKAKEFEPVDLREIADEVCEILEIRINESKAIISYDKLPVINGDSRQMKQLFQNLISNALKFKSENNPTIEISATEKKDRWQFKLQDNGIGFEMEYAERIFMAFHRLHNRAEYKGSGIGLAICKKIVQRHGGNIWAESEPGKGATFYFTFPK